MIEDLHAKIMDLKSFLETVKDENIPLEELKSENEKLQRNQDK